MPGWVSEVVVRQSNTRVNGEQSHFLLVKTYCLTETVMQITFLRFREVNSG